MPKLILEIEYEQEYIYDYLEEHVEIMEHALQTELEENYTPPIKPPKITYKKKK